MGYPIHLSLFYGGHLSTHYFRYLRHLSIFLQDSLFFLFFMNNSCIAHASFLQLKLFKRDIYQNLEHLS